MISYWKKKKKTRISGTSGMIVIIIIMSSIQPKKNNSKTFRQIKIPIFWNTICNDNNRMMIVQSEVLI